MRQAPRGGAELHFPQDPAAPTSPERARLRVPTTMNWDALRYMFRGAKIADIAIIVNSIDPCVSCTER